MPLLEGSWEQRKFYSIDIYDQPPEEIVTRLMDYLAKDNVVSRKAVDNAKAVYKTRQKEYEISKTLPRAWQKMIDEPDATLIDLIADNTEKMCGYRPDSLVVKNFMSSYLPASIDDLPLPIAKTPAGVKKVPRTTHEKRTVEYILRNASSSLEDLFHKLRQDILGLGDNVYEKVGGWYSDYRKSSTFTTITPQTKKNRLLVFIKLGDRKIVDPEKWAYPIPESWRYGKLNTQFEISEPSQVDYAIQLIKQAYDYVP